jgi:folylpolyglutamate synthase/dihydropteroate synthase
MSTLQNEILKEDAFEEVKQQYIDAGHTEEQAEALAQKFAEDNPDFWIKEEPFNYNAEWRS